MAKDDLECSFCGRKKPETSLLIAGLDAHICDRCIEQAHGIVAEEAKGEGNEEDGIKLSLKKYTDQKGLDESFQESTPLIGYALGFPTNVGVNGADYVTQHVHKDPENMDLDELKEFILERDFDIDLKNNDWTVEGLLEAISDNPEDDESESLKDIEEISIENN